MVSRDERKKMIELKKQIWKKEDYVGRLWNQLDNLLIKHYPNLPPDKQHEQLHNRLFKNIDELKVLKSQLKK